MLQKLHIRFLLSILLVVSAVFLNVGNAQVITLNTGGAVGASHDPLNYYNPHPRSAMFYTVAELGTGAAAKTIYAVSFYTAKAPPYFTGPTKIYVRNVAIAAPTQPNGQTTWTTKVAGATQVYIGTPTIHWGWNLFTFSAPWGVPINNSLEVLVECDYGDVSAPLDRGNPACTGIAICDSLGYHQPGAVRAQYFASANTTVYGDPVTSYTKVSANAATGTSSGNRPHTMIYENAVPVQTLGTITTNQSPPYSNVGVSSVNNYFKTVVVNVTNDPTPNKVTAMTFDASVLSFDPANDLDTAKLWTTYTYNGFSTYKLLGTFTGPFTAPFTFSFCGSPDTLYNGANYFYLSFSIKSSATPFDVVNVSCTNVELNCATNYTPTVVGPQPGRQINLIYCTPSYIAPGTGSGDYIDGVKLNNVSNLANGAAALPCSTYFVGTTANLYAGAPANNDTLYVWKPVGFAAAEVIRAWIDWDRNGIFDNTTEVLGGASVNIPAGTGTLVIAIPFSAPATAKIGITRMRIRMLQGSTPISLDPCAQGGIYNKGEVEDYDINVVRMDYSGSNCTQNLADIISNTANQDVIGIQFTTTGYAPALTIDSIYINLNGTTLLTDITNVKIYYTGNVSTFSPVGLFDTKAPIAGTIGFGKAIPQALVNGVNYFWVVVDVPVLPGTSLGHFIDAECENIKYNYSNGFAQYALPVNNAPAGSRPIPFNYCVINYTNGSGSGDFLALVNVGSINNATGALPAPYYKYYNLSTSPVVAPAYLNLGGTYPFNLTNGTYTGTHTMAVWIDINRDGDFYDVGEKMGEVTGTGANSPMSFVATLPAVGITGLPTRMRVRETRTVGPLDPCSVYAYGETEDYDVILLPSCVTDLWSGTISNAWNNPGNWCAGVPTITTDVLIPISVCGTCFWPVINPGVAAAANNLTISSPTFGPQGVTIKSRGTSSLTLAGDLNINGPNGRLTVDTSFVPVSTANIGVATSAFNEWASPYHQYFGPGSRRQYIYTAAELSTAGVLPFDSLSGIGFNILFKNASYDWSGWTIQLSHTTTASFTGSYLAGTWTTCFGPTTLSNAAIPSTGWYSTTFTNKFCWNGVDNLLVQICYAGSVQSADNIVSTITTTAAQTIEYETGAGCSMSTTLSWLNKPALQISLVGAGSGSVPWNGTPITIKGNWTNNGNFIPTISTVKFNGTANGQTIGGTTSTNFFNMYANNTSPTGGIVLNQNIQVRYNLNIQTSGLANGVAIDLNSYSIKMDSTNTPQGTVPYQGILTGEVNAKRIYDTSPSQAGTIYTIRYLNSAPGDVAGLGFKIWGASSPLGMTTVRRGHKPQNNLFGNYGIARYYDINGAVNSGLNAKITMKYLDNNELNGQAEAGLVAYRSKDAGITWPLQTGSVYTTPDSVTQTAVDTVGGATVRWTMSNFNTNNLPVTLVNFTAMLNENKTVDLKWETASELNNDYFTIEKTINGNDFDFVAIVQGAGNSSTLKTYTSVDEQPYSGLSYYRLRQTDFNGHQTVSRLVPVNNGEGLFELINVAADQSGNELSIVFNNNNNDPVSISVFDMIGKQLLNKDNIMNNKGANLVKIDISNLSNGGLYFVMLQNKDKVFTRKFGVSR